MNWYFDWDTMNWYKKAQIIMNDNDENNGIPYTDIGHNSYTDKKLGFLWFWGNGKLIVEEQDYRGLYTHETMMPGAFAEGYYKGRYDPNTNKLSLVRPDDEIVRDVPKPLIRALTGRFGKDIIIHVY